MLMKTPPQPSSRIKVLALAADAEFEQSMRALAGGAGRIEIDIVSGWPARTADGIAFDIDVDIISDWSARAPEEFAFDADVIVVDIDNEGPDSLATLQQLVVEVAGRLPIIAATRAFDADVGRRLMHLRIADFLLKPVTAADLMRACTRVSAGRFRGTKGRGRDLHLPAGERRCRCHDVGDPDRTAAARVRSRRTHHLPVWSISTSSRARAPTISTSSRGSTSTRSSRGRSASTRNCSKSCCRTMPPALRSSARPTGQPRCAPSTRR